MVFAQEQIRDALKELKPLIWANDREAGLFHGELNPHFETYFELQDKGMASLFTARVNGELKGYSVFFVIPHLHYPHLKWATADVLFMDKAHRGIGSIKFLQWCDRTLREHGVDVVVRQVNAFCDYSRTLERMSYARMETSYIRRLG